MMEQKARGINGGAGENCLLFLSVRQMDRPKGSEWWEVYRLLFGRCLAPSCAGPSATRFSSVRPGELYSNSNIPRPFPFAVHDSRRHTVERVN